MTHEPPEVRYATRMTDGGRVAKRPNLPRIRPCRMIGEPGACGLTCQNGRERRLAMEGLFKGLLGCGCAVVIFGLLFLFFLTAAFFVI